MKKRIMWVWVHRNGSIKTELSPKEFFDSEDHLYEYGPGMEKIYRMEKQGYVLSNWHIIEK